MRSVAPNDQGGNGAIMAALLPPIIILGICFLSFILVYVLRKMRADEAAREAAREAAHRAETGAHTGNVTCVAAAEDGNFGQRVLTGSGDKTVKVWRGDAVRRITIEREAATDRLGFTNSTDPAAGKVTVLEVNPSSVAYAAGLRVGMVIVEANGTALGNNYLFLNAAVAGQTAIVLEVVVELELVRTIETGGSEFAVLPGGARFVSSAYTKRSG